MTTHPIHITICMGSSCFCRGNNRNIEVLQDLLKREQASARCQLEGHLCRQQCKRGPNIQIDGTEYHEVDPVALIVLCNQSLSRAAAAPEGDARPAADGGPAR